MKQAKSLFSMADRKAWVNVFLSGKQSLQEVSEQAGVSHQMLYKWVKKEIESPCVR